MIILTLFFARACSTLEQVFTKLLVAAHELFFCGGSYSQYGTGAYGYEEGGAGALMAGSALRLTHAADSVHTHEGLRGRGEALFVAERMRS